MTTVRAPSLAGMTVYSWPFGVGLGELFRDALWIIFFIGASSAPHPLDITNVERYFWFPADLAVAVVAVVHKNELFELARKHAIFLTWPALACISVIWSFTPSTSLYHGVQLLMTILVGLVLCQYACSRGSCSSFSERCWYAQYCRCSTRWQKVRLAANGWVCFRTRTCWGT